MNWLIYGANGYSGQLIAKEAVRRGLEPVLAGRNREALERLSAQLVRESRVFSLSKPATLREQLEDIDLVVNCAGPFSKTALPLVEACLELKIHYLDITGEISVFEKLHSLDAKAKSAAISLIPGVGFDVVPTDCLASMLKKNLPTATTLEIAFKGNSKTSPGTLKTMVENIPHGTTVRRNGKLIQAPWGSHSATLPFASGDHAALCIPWGDLATAFYSTQIPNITCFAAAPSTLITLAPIIQKLTPLFKLELVQQIAGRAIKQFVQGPTDRERAKIRMEVWGRVSDGTSEVIQAIEVSEGYHFTQESTLKIVERFLHKPPTPGYLTPSQAFGADFVFEIAHSRRLV